MGLLKIYDNNGKLIEVKEIEGQDVSVIREQDIVKPKSRVLVVGDLHEPFSHAKYLDFCIDTYNNFNCNKVVLIGDLIDNHATSNWGSDPEGKSAADELELAVEKLKLWYKQFPEATVTLGNHDCYDAETEILTSEGWKRGIDLSINDKVATMNMETKNIEYQLPIGLIKKEYDGEMHRYKSKATGVDLFVTPNHRMVVYNKHEKSDEYSPKIKLSKDIKRSRVHIPVSLGNNNKGIEMSDDMIRLIAWIITDGSIINKNTFIVYQSKNEMCVKIKHILNNLNIKFKESKRVRDIKEICGKKLKNKPLDSFEFYFHSKELYSYIQNKYEIPKIMWKLSDRQFDIFIESLIDGDGSRYSDTRKCMYLYGIEKVLSQVQSICIQHKYSAIITKYRDVHFKLAILKNRTKIGYEAKDIKTVENYKGIVWCATVKNGTLVVRRNFVVSICGNCRPFRKAFKAGLPPKWLKDFNQLIEAPKRWKFVERIFIDGVLYEHGTQSGDMAAVNVARNHRCSVVVGHGHSFSGVRYLSSSVNGTIFAANVGCGIDENAYAFAYGKSESRRPVISCGVVLEGKQCYITKYE